MTLSIRQKTETGAVLVLALLFMIAIGIAIVALANFAVSSSRNTVNLKYQTTLEIDSESIASAVIQEVRASYTYPSTGPTTQYGNAGTFGPTQPCTPSGILAHNYLAVYCSGTQYSGSRLVDFYVCQSSVSQATCTSGVASDRLLFASITFNDVPIGGAASASACYYATASNFSNATCGITMTIDTWEIPLADQ